MGRFVEGEDQRQSLLLPDSLDDYVTEDNPVRVVEVFVDELDLGTLGFKGMQPATTGRPAYRLVFEFWLNRKSRPYVSRPSSLYRFVSPCIACLV